MAEVTFNGNCQLEFVMQSYCLWRVCNATVWHCGMLCMHRLKLDGLLIIPTTTTDNDNNLYLFLVKWIRM